MYETQPMYQLLKDNAPSEALDWLNDRLLLLDKTPSARNLFMTYSLLSSKFDKHSATTYADDSNKTAAYFEMHHARILDIARIYLLRAVLDKDLAFYTPEVAKIIQVADTTELETFLRYLILLPAPESFNYTAVEALRTNISIIFDAITLNNPYPALYFNDQQWNQMYLKAAFMERDLGMIASVDDRANEDLTRIISDYAHERWAASRKIDPMFWRPVARFMNDTLRADMLRLLQSDDSVENKAGALCCYFSEDEKATALLDTHTTLKAQIAAGILTWETLKN